MMMFNAESLPKLLDIARNTVAAALIGVSVARYGKGFALETMHMRAIAIASTFLFMKRSGTFFYPVAGSVTLVFIDQAAALETKLGWYYALMPALSGTLVLMLMAAVKIQLAAAI